MFATRFATLAAVLSLTFGFARAEAEEPTKEVAHAQMLEKRYPISAFKVLMAMKVSQQLFQEAINDAHESGVPSHLLSELVALRAMRNADARSLELALPALKAELGRYRPEASLFADEASEATAIQTMEKVLQEEKSAPGSLARRAKFAKEMEIARSIRYQLTTVDSSVDQEAIERNLQVGTPVPDARWRSHLKKGTKLADEGTDELGNAFGPQIVDTPPTVPKASYQRLKAVVPDSFWAPFGVPK